MLAPDNEKRPQAEEPAGVEGAAGDGVQVNGIAAHRTAAPIVSEFPPPPYPTTTKAGDFRFELDIARMHRSDTWAIAERRQRPFLVMVWIESWTQFPAGSMPDDDNVIAARIGMSKAEFEDCKDVLMRGWWKASDGRLYHPVITEQVVDMVKRKNRKSANQAAYRERLRLKDESDAEVAGHSSATDPEVTGHPPVIDRTYHIPRTTEEQEQKHLPEPDGSSCTEGNQDGDVGVDSTAASSVLIPLKGGSEYTVTAAEVAEWTLTYPDKDVPGELRKMRQWCLADPARKKTPKGVKKFVTGWLARPPMTHAPSGRRNNTDAHFEGIAEKFANYNGPTVSLL